jgi:ABC-type sugar transport system ATPase subunit
MASINIENANFSYQNTNILNDFNLEIKDKEFLVLVGPSGCGKSSLLRIISGLSDLDSGDIMVAGESVKGLEPKNRDIAMVFQSYALYPHLSVRENISFPLKLRKLSSEEINRRVAKVAAALELEKLLDRKPKQLSGGQKQRVAMGRAIVRRPKAFLFDEPLSNLDASLRDKMRTEIKKRHELLKTTTIYVTHDQTEAMTLADRIVVLNKGVIQQLGTPYEIYDKPKNRFVAQFMGSPNMNFCDGSLINEELREYELGFRPEDLKLSSAYSSDTIKFDCRLEVIEPLGSENLLNLRWKNQIIQWKCYKRNTLKAGDILQLQIDIEKCHVFSKKNGLRVKKSDALCDTGRQLPNKTNSAS